MELQYWQSNLSFGYGDKSFRARRCRYLSFRRVWMTSPDSAWMWPWTGWWCWPTAAAISSVCRRTIPIVIVRRYWRLEASRFDARFPWFSTTTITCRVPCYWGAQFQRQNRTRNPWSQNCCRMLTGLRRWAFGLARVFAVSGALGVALFDAEDPFARQRSQSDKQYALDHFQTKLLTLPLTMQTEHGRHLAQCWLLTDVHGEAECGVKRREWQMLDLDAIQTPLSCVSRQYSRNVNRAKLC